MDIWDELGKLFSGDSKPIILTIVNQTMAQGPIDLTNPTYVSVYAWFFGFMIIASVVVFVARVIRNQRKIATGEMDGKQMFLDLLYVQIAVWSIPVLVTLASYLAQLGANGVVKWASDEKTFVELMPNGVQITEFSSLMGLLLLVVAALANIVIQLETLFFGILVFFTTILLELFLLNIVLKGELGEKGQKALSYTIVGVFWQLIFGGFMALGSVLVNGIDISAAGRQLASVILIVVGAGLPFILVKKTRASVKTRIDGMVKTRGDANGNFRPNPAPSSNGAGANNGRYLPAKASNGSVQGKTARQVLRETARSTMSDMSGARDAARTRWIDAKRQIVSGKQAQAKTAVVAKAANFLPPQFAAPVRAALVTKRVLGVIKRSGSGGDASGPKK